MKLNISKKEFVQRMGLLDMSDDEVLELAKENGIEFVSPKNKKINSKLRGKKKC